jgi:hypothetical protein
MWQREIIEHTGEEQMNQKQSKDLTRLGKLHDKALASTESMMKARNKLTRKKWRDQSKEYALRADKLRKDIFATLPAL